MEGEVFWTVLRRSLFSSYTALTRGPAPLHSGRSELTVISWDTTVGVCIFTSCYSKQHMTQNTRAVLCLAHPSAIRVCFLLPLCVAFSLSPGQSVWPLCELRQTPVFVVPSPLLNTYKVWNEAARCGWCKVAYVSFTSLCARRTSLLCTYILQIRARFFLSNRQKKADNLFHMQCWNSQNELNVSEWTRCLEYFLDED